eukprot:CAMPEP_0179418276 /NCGR_PEP_ID=MMETSP0799-20121207/7890_1 /TAXON_ID=46947 /ORGANISM="Geminigera cryophila, Strain CCMP2564" /LENGTH=51 /DNA_ID=CAMNT_0021191493 /DNA_START=104 /DNA_END=259 /DNA_ORIENTATION=+
MTRVIHVPNSLVWDLTRVIYVPTRDASCDTRPNDDSCDTYVPTRSCEIRLT